MSLWTALVVIIIVLAVVRLRLEKYRAFGRGADGGEPLPEPEREALHREVQELHDRIAVLERIITDERRSQAIAEEIESLREP